MKPPYKTKSPKMIEKLKRWLFSRKPEILQFKFEDRDTEALFSISGKTVTYAKMRYENRLPKTANTLCHTPPYITGTIKFVTDDKHFKSEFWQKTHKTSASRAKNSRKAM